MGKRKIKPRVRLGEEPSDDSDTRQTSVLNTEKKSITSVQGRGRSTAAIQKRRKVEIVTQPESQSQNSSKSNVDQSQNKDS